jgi:hypothetical protein
MSEPMVTITLSEYEKLTKETTGVKAKKSPSFLVNSAQSAMTDLRCFVAWSETPQGYSYWAAVVDNLDNMIKENS